VGGNVERRCAAKSGQREPLVSCLQRWAGGVPDEH